MSDQYMEVELRAILTNSTVTIHKIETLGGVFKNEVSIIDLYFCPKRFTQISEVEMDEVCSYSLRVRKTIIDGVESITMNSKTITSFGDHQAWEEHEVQIAEFEEIVKLLTATEFKPFFILEKTRKVYTLDDIEISVEDIKDFGGAIEAEILTSEDDVNASKVRLKSLFDELSISSENIATKSITNLVMHERAFKQEITV